MILEGLLMSVPKLITGAVLDAPMKKFKMGIISKAPPPPLIVESVNESTPITKMSNRNNRSISFRISKIATDKYQIPINLNVQ